MNKRGQTFFLGFMIGITIIVLALALAPGLQTQIEETRNTDNLNCADVNSTLSTFDKTTCVITDINLFYFIGGLIVIAGSVITARLIKK